MISKATSFVLLLFLFRFGFAQSIVTDTVPIKFKADTIIPVNYFWQSAIDNRDVNPKIVSYAKTTKYLLIPVDQEVCLPKPLATILSKNTATNALDSFNLEIDYFIIEKYKGRFINPYVLYANMPLSRIVNGKKEYVGTLIYNYEYQPARRKTPYAQACEELLGSWHSQFKIDMLSVENFANNDIPRPQTLISEEIKKPYYFNVNLSTVVGLNFWQIEGELDFTRPEAEVSRWFTGSFIRYQQTDEFEMIGFGKKAEHYTKRINNKAEFDISSNLIFGLNKWKNVNDIKLWQLFQLSLSSSQSINFNKLNQPGFLFKAGLFENIYYIVDKTPGFQVGPYLSIGYKF